jgi:arylsulfatase A-like enzyme
MVKGVAQRFGTRTWLILFVAVFAFLWVELPTALVHAVVASEVPGLVARPTSPARKLVTAQPTADLVVLVSIDGFRPDAITPDMRGIHRLYLQGASAHVARTIDKSATLPSHASMVSGVDPEQHGLNFNAYRPEHAAIARPTVFSVAHAAGLPTAMFVGKAKLKHLLNKPTDAAFTMGGMNCDKLLKEALPYLREANNGLVFLHFADPDSAGHRYGWMTEEYQNAALKADRCLERVIDTLSDAGKEERTLLLVTSDHGGHGKSHGTRLDVDARIPWYAWGAGAQRGRVSRAVNTVDTAATALSALGLERPAGMHGRPVDEAITASCGPTGLPLVGAPVEAAE